MFKIGEFSKICQITVKTLRHYDKLGLFRPAKVDPDSGYRFYSATQLTVLNKILAFREMGLSLDEICMLLKGDVPVEQMKGMLLRKQVELKQQINEESARLARVETRLNNIERGEFMSDYEVIIKDVPEMIVAGIRRVVPTFADVGPLFMEMMPFFEQHKALASGPCFSRCFDKEYKEHDVDLEALMPLTQEVPGSGNVKVYRLEGETMAAAIHSGPYEKLFSAYESLMKWMEENGYELCAPNRELYIVGYDQTQDPEKFVTEIQIPVKPAAS